MAFRVQQKPYGSKKYVTFRAEQAESNIGPENRADRLYWVREREGERDPSLPLIEMHFPLDVGTGQISDREAEQATGLLPPVCFDKIMDLM